jgi:hypothetical protein
MYNILSIGRASVFVMPCYALEQALEEPSPPKATTAHPTRFTTFRVELGLFHSKKKKKHFSLFKSWNHAKLVGIDYRCIDL